MLEAFGNSAYYYLAFLILIAIFYMVFMVDREPGDEDANDEEKQEDENSQ